MHNQTTYDEVPYESHAFAQTHPDRLATIGHLFGMSPRPVTECRVLELGCASGGNLIPMSFNLPGSEFVGIDLSERQVHAGQQTIDDLNLENIRIKHASILDIDAEYGLFDYIICHGVYSWVPDKVQEKILSICSANLAPNGIAYVSYNTYPGWHMREIIRHGMRYHADQFEDTDQRIEQARALIDFMVDAVPADSGYYGLLLKNELALVRASRDSYLFHEHLEDVNKPIYFHQFIERAQQHKLQYLGEADVATMLTSGFPADVAETLDRISPDIIRSEQYMDFLRNRHFRQTLLCHGERDLKRALDADSLKGLLVASNTRPAAPDRQTADSDGKQVYITPHGVSIATQFALTKAAFAVLNEHWPHAIDLDALVDKAHAAASTRADDQDRKTLADDLLHSYTANAVELHTWQADFTPNISDKPKVSDLARYRLAHDQAIVNQRHETANVDQIGQELIRILDGNRDRNDLLQELLACVERGVLVIEDNGVPLLAEDVIRKAMERVMADTLRKLANVALLVA